MDVEAIQQELKELQKEKNETKQRLDSFRPGSGRFGDRGPRFGDRGPKGPYSNERADDGEGRAGERSYRPGRGMDSGQGGPGPSRGGGVFSRLAGGALGFGSKQQDPGGGLGAERRGGYRESFQHDDRVRHSGLGGGLGGPGAPRRFNSMGDHDDRDGRGRFGQGFADRMNGVHAEPVSSAPPAAAAAAAAGRRKLLSAVVVDTGSKEQQENGEGEEPQGNGTGGDDSERWDSAGQDRLQQHQQQEGGGAGGGIGRKRPAAESEGSGAPVDGNAKKRNRRMFGMLLGTLQRFREEDEQFSHSDVAFKRSDALRKAEEREKAQSDQLRKKEAAARAAMRSAELDKLAALSLATDTKVLELLYASRIARKEKLSRFLITKAHPPVLWLPAQDSRETDALKHKQQQELQEWKASMLSELDVERQGLVERSKARREAALARRAAREERIKGGAIAGEGAGEGQTREEEEDEKALEAGEYAVMRTARTAEAMEEDDQGEKEEGKEDPGKGGADEEEGPSGSHKGRAGGKDNGKDDGQNEGGAMEVEGVEGAGASEEEEEEEEDDVEGEREAETVLDLLA